MKRFGMILVSIASIMGCAHPTLPRIYSQVSPDQVLAILRQRSAAIHTVSAQGLITLSHRSGDSIRLEAALVARMPSELHLRAWKFNRTVFDLTLTPAGLWMLAPDEPRM